MQVPVINNLNQDQYRKYLELLPALKTKRNSKYIWIILTLLSSIILGIFAINPTLSTIAGLQKQIADNTYLEAKMQEKINNIASLDEQYKKIEQDLQIVFDAIPQQAEATSLVGLMQAIAKSANINKLNNLQLTKIELSKQLSTNKNFSAYSFNLNAYGNYQSLMNFVNKLMNFQRIITVDTISISKPTTRDVAGLEINITGNTYFKQ